MTTLFLCCTIYLNSMHISKAIEQLGYKSHEAKVYLAALGLGECTVSDISQKIKMPRTSVQSIVDKLHSDGLMNFYIKKRYKYWHAENPEYFLTQLKEREAALRTVLPRMSAMRKDGGSKPVVKIFNNIDDIKLIHQDMLGTKHNILAVVPWNSWVELLGLDYLDDFVETRVNHFLKIKLLVPRTPSSVKLRERDVAELRHTRFLPRRIEIEDVLFIYSDKVALISLNKKNPTGILIDDPSTSRTMKVFFDEIWNQSV